MVRRSTLRALLAFGCFVALAEMADFLYAPTDYILIDRLLRPIDVASYAPAVQIDGALLLMVLAVADVLLPKTALAHHAGKRDAVRRYYFRGTLATAGILAATSVGAYFTAPLIFKFWLGAKLPTTRAILPLVLIHTVIGGSSAVGRSILLGMGKVRAFTAAVLIAGVINVILSYCFVRYCHWGLRGIILGTIVAVVGRCGVWMPWYVVRTLNRSRSGEVEFATLPAAGGPF
jgi:O-antigen/teichoic acid export membrane protein